ncbi:MAG: AbrB/MazE/SpoVT family DNA-binding domain-containing protein [Pseudonocardiaceae bacterium]|nr:AbrB/MazE/SpoVT family DNA-binding domain-containing protein [Pseudonocardiaceae bacterium]
MRAVVSGKGQVTIPKAVRDRLGISAGQVLDFDDEQGTLVARKVAEFDPIDDVYGILDLPGGTDAFVADARGTSGP